MIKQRLMTVIAVSAVLSVAASAKAEISKLKASEAASPAACSAENAQAKKCSRWYNVEEKAQPDACVTAKQAGGKCSRWYSVGAPAPAPKEEVIVLRGINFDTGKADIRSDSIPILENNVKGLQKKSKSHITIEGHTDARGSDASNQKLSEARANSVLNWFASHGVDRGRMSAVGKGESQPVASNNTEEGMFQNRRIELHLNQ